MRRGKTIRRKKYSDDSIDPLFPQIEEIKLMSIDSSKIEMSEVSHVKKNCFIYTVIAHPLFNFTIILLIIANIIVLA